jgi:amino acid transporter/mannitol/fructose-specific phosphotransferase system IIA component (Ntr-type)
VKRSLRALDVYAIATGAMIGSGFFLLPGIAFQHAGPAVVLSYLLAAVLIVPTVFSNAELSTAMPRSGGTYFFVSRTMGSMAGVIDGLGGWLGMAAKSAFSLAGIGWYVLAAFGRGEEAQMIARVTGVSVALLLAVVNVLGAKEAGLLQRALVAFLLLICAWFVLHGSTAVDAAMFTPLFPHGTEAVLATAGLVFVSYAGFTKVASVSEEVADPNRSIPRGMLLALATSALIYVLGVLITVGLVPAGQLAGSRIPLVAAARVFAGPVGAWAVVIAGVLAFVTTANAGILSCSRHLQGMGRDMVVPPAFAAVSRRGVPLAGVAVSTALMIAAVLLLDVEKIAKLASTFVLLDFALVNLAVVVMRESRVRSYDPGFRSPLYPWAQVIGALSSLLMIEMMGWWAIGPALALLAAGLVWYAAYARGKAEHAAAVMHVLERIAVEVLSRDSAGPALDRELREIMKERGLRPEDPFAEAIGRARVIDLPETAEWEELMKEAVAHFSERYPEKADAIRRGLYDASKKGDTPAAEGIALPHVLLEGARQYEVLMARARSPLHFPGVAQGVRAVFVLLGCKENPQQHLRMLASVARRAEEQDFLQRWMKAEDEEHLKRIMLGLPGH